MGGGGDFSSLKAFLLPFSPCGGDFGYVFPRMGRFFSQFKIKGLFCSFFHVEAFLLRLPPYGGLFSPFKNLSATFSSMWGPFCYVFSPYVGLFSLFEGPFCYVFLLLGDRFHHLKAFLLLFSLCGGIFSYVFLVGRAFFYLLKAFLLLFFSMWECCFWFYEDPF